MDVGNVRRFVRIETLMFNSLIFSIGIRRKNQAMMMTRLAPTPSGFLHEGNLYNFLYNWLWARVNGGKVLLRIDDADASRFRMAYLENIFRMLDLIGLDWDVGPSGPDDFVRQWSQQLRVPLYHQLLSELRDNQFVFACNCSRSTLATVAANSPVYPGTCESKDIPADAPDVSWRILFRGEARILFQDKQQGRQDIDMRLSCGSFVVRRRDGIPAYQVCSLADDLYFGVTHVARGSDLILSTASQLWLAASLEKEKFLQTTFLHHSLLMDSKKEKLSKSVGNAQGSLMMVKPEKLFGRFAAFSGIAKSEAPLSLDALMELAKKCDTIGS